MKKLLAIVLAVLSAFSMTAVAYAENTTTLTTTVPDATYTLNIPADQEIAFGATSTKIGRLSVSGENFAVGKNLEVTINYDAFKSEDVTTTIPFGLSSEYIDYYSLSSQEYSYGYAKIPSGSSITFLGESDGGLENNPKIPNRPDDVYDDDYWRYGNLYIGIASSAWGKALGGDYSATITFSAEVVAG